MIVHECEQGDRRWWALRLGRPTVSRFARILTPKALQYSSAAQAFAAELIAEKMLGKPVDDKEVDTIWTRRGSEEEAAARKWYSFYRDTEVTEVGFITTDDGKVGGSPDGLVGDDGGVEIKCRSAKKHMACVLGIEPIADLLQVQGYLWLTGREYWDVVAYNSELPKRIQRRYPVPAVQEAMTEYIEQFLGEMETAEKALAKRGDVLEDDELLLLQLAESLKAGAS